MISRIRRLPAEVILFVCLNIANTSNYLYQVVMGRALGPASYGLLASVVQLVNVVTVSSIALQTASAKAIASSVEPLKPLKHAWNDPLTRTAIVWSGVVAMVLVIAAPFIALFLHGGVGPGLVLGAVVIPSCLLALGQGRLQGLHALHAFAALAVVAALLRLVFGPLAVYLGLGVTGAGMALAVAAAVASVWALRYTRKAGPVRVADVHRDLGRGAFAFVAFWLMVSADIVIARHYLPANIAGQYAVASVVGKSVLWLPSAIAIAIFPRVARHRSAGLSTAKLLNRSLLLTLGLGVIAVAGLAVAGRAVIPLFFGLTYVPASTLAWRVGLACIPFSLANLLIYYHLASDGVRLSTAIVAAAICETFAMALFHAGTAQIATSLGAGGLALFAGLFIVLFGRVSDAVEAPDVPSPFGSPG